LHPDFAGYFALGFASELHKFCAKIRLNFDKNKSKPYFITFFNAKIKVKPL
jgi:hypothetical protein